VGRPAMAHAGDEQRRWWWYVVVRVCVSRLRTSIGAQLLTENGKFPLSEAIRPVS